MMTIPANT